MKKILVNFVVFSLLGILVSCSGNAKSTKEVSKEKEGWCSEHNMSEKKCNICNPSLDGKVIISPESQLLAEIKTEKITFQSVKNKISATGKVTYNEKKLLNIVSRVSGRIEEVFAFMQSKVTVAEPLLSLYSPEYLTTQAEYLQAEERLKRVKQLNNPEEETTAKGIYESARQKLKIIGILEKEIAVLEETHIIKPYLTVHAPFSGTIVESNVLQGNFIQLETNLYKLADLSTLWIIADIYERDISKVENKQKVEITTNIYPNEIFIGQITATGDVLDEKTRTFKIKIDINNVSGKLKPEMFVNISILTNEESILAIPKKAVLTDGENKIVFVSFGKNVFVKREIKLGRETDEIVEIFSGLKTGENVVTEGNFLLKSELLKSKMGAGCAE